MSNPKDLMQQGARLVAARGIQRDVERAARAQAGDTDATAWIPIQQITIDPAIQVRVNGGDPETIEQYAVIMVESQGWGPFPPVDVHRDGDKLYLSAGFQRIEAAQIASGRLVAEGLPAITEIPCTVRPGGYEAAIEFAENDNLEHGKPLTTQDKFKMFYRRLDRGHRWMSMSSRAIAREIGVSKDSISRWRAAWEARESSLTGSNEPVSGNEGKKRAVVTADGRVMKTSKIQRANKKRAAKPQPAESEPVATFENRGGETVVDRIMAALHEHGTLGPAHLRAVSGMSPEAFNLLIDDLMGDGWIERYQDVNTGRVYFRALVQPENPNAVGNLDQGEPPANAGQLRQIVIHSLNRAADALDQLGETSDAQETRRYAASLKADWRLNG